MLHCVSFMKQNPSSEICGDVCSVSAARRSTVLVTTLMHNRKRTGPRGTTKHRRRGTGSSWGIWPAGQPPTPLPPRHSFPPTHSPSISARHMSQMQSQIKVSVALMNKRAQPICAAAERERGSKVRLKENAKQTTWWFWP